MYSHFLKHSHLQILLNLRKLFTAGMAVHKFSLCLVCINGLPGINEWKSEKPLNQIKHPENEEKIDNDHVWGMTIHVGSKLLDQFQWSWYHSFQKTMFYLMKSKYAIFSNIKVTKIERSTFLGTPGIIICNAKCYHIAGNVLAITMSCCNVLCFT